MKRILVTGACGYIGSVLCQKLLDAGYFVRAYDNILYGQRVFFNNINDNYEFIRGDVRDEHLLFRALKGMDVVMPLAAIVGATACDMKKHDCLDINYKQIKFISNNFDGLIVFPNTTSGYGITTGDELCTEDSPMYPISYYGQVKCEAEKILIENRNAITLRLATVFGVSQRTRLDLLVNDLTYKAFRDRYIVMFEPNFKRNYIHVQDVADCFIFCIENSDKLLGQKVYNLGNDSANMTKLQLAETIKKYLPNTYIHCSEIVSDPDKRNYIISHERLNAAGFIPKRSLDYGIKELIAMYSMVPEKWRNA